MKIEKITDNKIRIIINPSDLENEDIDVHSLMSKAFEGQNFFSKVLERAKKEVGFNTDGCKLLIEAFSSQDDALIFTITKFSSKDSNSYIETHKKKLNVKRKSIDFSKKQAIYSFKNFDEFCDFCEYITTLKNFDIKNFSKNISLYIYNYTYYLIIKNINTSYKYAKTFYSISSEFLKPLTFSSNFENKLIEHGKVLFKKNAITTTIKHFSSKN